MTPYQRLVVLYASLGFAGVIVAVAFFAGVAWAAGLAIATTAIAVGSTIELARVDVDEDAAPDAEPPTRAMTRQAIARRAREADVVDEDDDA